MESDTPRLRPVGRGFRSSASCAFPFSRVAAGIACGAFLLLAAGCHSTEREARDLAALRADRDRELAGLSDSVAPPAPEAPPRALPTVAERPPADALPPARAMPDWVSGRPPSEYPASRFLVGLGSCRKMPGKDYECLLAAEDRARDAIARSLRVRVRSEYRSEARAFAQIRSGQSIADDATTAIENRITSTADESLEGVAIVDRWQDAKGEAWWALAAMDRGIAAAAVVDRAEMLRGQIASAMERGRALQEAGQSFRALAQFRAARGKALAILGLRGQLRVIAAEAFPADRIALTPELLKALWEETERCASSVRVAVCVFTDRKDAALTGRIQSVFSAALRELELDRVETPPPPAEKYEATARLSADALRRWAGDRWNVLWIARLSARETATDAMGALHVHFYRAASEGVVHDLAEGRIVARAAPGEDPSTHTGNPDPAKAEEDSLLKAARALAAELTRQIAETLGEAPAPSR